MNLSFKKFIAFLIIVSLIIISLLGCANNTSKADYKDLLMKDAESGFKNTLQSNYNQISLFRGEIYKLSIVSTIPKKIHYIGSSMGVISATIINPEYEFNRIKNGENITSDISNEVTSRKIIEVISRNQLVLNNIYRVILVPLNDQLTQGKDINQSQQLELDELIRLTNRLLDDYSIIINSEDLTDSNLNVQLKSMQKSQNELLNLTIPKI